MTALLGDDVATTLAALTQRLDAARLTNIGFPGAVDFDYRDLAPLLSSQLLNNVGDPWVDGHAANQTKQLERDVIDWVADRFRAPENDRWGYITSGGTEGNIYGLQLARSLYPKAIVYHSAAAHPSVHKAIGLLRLESVTIRNLAWGELDYDDLAHQVDQHRRRPAIVLATIGTTMTEAVDDVSRIRQILDFHAIERRFIHADAALSGIPLALLPPDGRPGFDLADGADCITISGHKFIGCPFPCGVVVTRNSLRLRVEQPTHYTGSPDTTITGSRSGHTPLLLWHRLKRLGLEGMTRRASDARALAAYTHRRLLEAGWTAHRHPHGFTVCLATPPATVLKRWVLAVDGPWSHVITMPGITRDQVDAFLADLTAAAGVDTQLIAPARAAVPQPRPPQPS